MPFYIGDYLRDTVHLTLSQHGAYFKSILQYWSKGESLTDMELRGICRREFKVVSGFYVLEGGRWHHKRIDLELEKARKRSEVARENGRRGGMVRRDQQPGFGWADEEGK